MHILILMVMIHDTLSQVDNFNYLSNIKVEDYRKRSKDYLNSSHQIFNTDILALAQHYEQFNFLSSIKVEDFPKQTEGFWFTNVSNEQTQPGLIVKVEDFRQRPTIRFWNYNDLSFSDAFDNVNTTKTTISPSHSLDSSKAPWYYLKWSVPHQIRSFTGEKTKRFGLIDSVNSYRKKLRQKRGILSGLLNRKNGNDDVEGENSKTPFMKQALMKAKDKLWAQIMALFKPKKKKRKGTTRTKKPKSTVKPGKTEKTKHPKPTVSLAPGASPTTTTERPISPRLVDTIRTRTYDPHMYRNNYRLRDRYATPAPRSGWIVVYDDNIWPVNAFAGYVDLNGDRLYVGRGWMNDGTLIPGYVKEGDHCLQVNKDWQGHCIRPYEILAGTFLWETSGKWAKRHINSVVGGSEHARLLICRAERFLPWGRFRFIGKTHIDSDCKGAVANGVMTTQDNFDQLVGHWQAVA